MMNKIYLFLALYMLTIGCDDSPTGTGIELDGMLSGGYGSGIDPNSYFLLGKWKLIRKEYKHSNNISTFTYHNDTTNCKLFIVPIYSSTPLAINGLFCAPDTCTYSYISPNTIKLDSTDFNINAIDPGNLTLQLKDTIYYLTKMY